MRHRILATRPDTLPSHVRLLVELIPEFPIDKTAIANFSLENCPPEEKEHITNYLTLYVTTHSIVKIFKQDGTRFLVRAYTS